MQERFWWPGMARDLRNRIRKCGRCKKFEAAPPVAPLRPLTCSGPGELLHVDFTSIEETVPLREELVIRNVMVMQDHFSKYVVAYVVKDKMARTAAETLRNGYFRLFGAPAYLVSDQGKAFTGHLISNLCELYGVQKLRTSPYHAQTNGQVERMNQTIITMIGKLEQDKKARWSEHLPEMLAAYNGTRLAVTGYSPYFLLFGRKSRMPVDCLFPTLRDSPHQAKMEVSVAAMQKRLKEAFAVARHLTSQEAARQRRYYDRKAGAVALQPGDVVMVRTDGFVGKRKVKDRWEDGGFIVESQLEDWPVYKVRCPTSDVRQKPKYRILHRNRLLLVTNEDDPVVPGQLAQAKVSPVVSNATPEATGEEEGPSGPLPSLVTRQEGDTPPFKERFRRIPPPQLDEVRTHLKMMLDAGVIRPSNSPWCNAVVLVRKKDGSLHFCIDFRRLNSLTVKDSHPLPRICETLESLAGAANYTTIDMNSGFWQVPMDDESKQYAAFTLGSMGLYECESMPFGLCNAPPTFQRLMLNCLGELNLTYCLIYLDDVIIFSKTEEEHLERMRVVFDRFREHGLKLKPSKCAVFKTEINYLAHHVSKRGVLPSKKNLEAIAPCPPPDTYTKVKSFVGLVGHYRRFIKRFANITAPLYDLTSGENKDKKSEHLDLPLKACEAFGRLKAACLQAPILAFPDFGKPFLLETDTSGKGLGAVLSQKQSDGRYHPITYASRIMTETEQRYHSNKQEFLALKWAVTEQFHEYLSPYGKNRNQFVVRTDNNPLTYIFSSANLDAAGQRWVAQLASYNFALEYQKGKDNTVADFLSRLDDHLPPGKVQDYLNKIPYPGVKAVLDNAITPLNERAEQGVRPDPDNQEAGPEVTVGVRPARLATTNITNWKLEQQEDPVLYQVVKHRKASRETFKEALLKVTDRKAVSAYVKSKDQLVMKNGLLYRQSKQGQTQETVLQFVVPQIHRNAALDGCHREAAHQGQS